ncbi:MAG: alpha-D-ribose 1-methylphosphonate 5-phosphate C-P-lyase PhnJ [Thermus sp.]|uniref:alpha-D-ribose 1-methylphosphonate 5-phosphate C-P-lyase PhnJ n=1 Tax=Thermus sp. TaxID=275 RepID=UPI00391C7767
MRLSELTPPQQDYSYAFLDAYAKREIRRAILKAICLPGYQVSYASRELPIARGWGTGGLQVTLSLVGPSDVVKVIDQGDDNSVNAANLRRFISRVAGVRTTTDALEATLIQSRHRIPEEVLEEHQILILQVPYPEPLYHVEPSLSKARELHAENDYSLIWLYLYESLVRYGKVMHGADYPMFVNGRYLAASSPIPRWDLPKLHMARHLTLLSAGREKRLYAVPPYTEVIPVQFEDVPFEVEDQRGWLDWELQVGNKFMNVIPLGRGGVRYEISDSGYRRKLLSSLPTGPTYYDQDGRFYIEGFLKGGVQ